LISEFIVKRPIRSLPESSLLQLVDATFIVTGRCHIFIAFHFMGAAVASQCLIKLIASIPDLFFFSFHSIPFWPSAELLGIAIFFIKFLPMKLDVREEF